MVAMVTVLLGTLYPLVIQALGLGKLSVGAPYFNTVFVPLMAPLIFLMVKVQIRSNYITSIKDKQVILFKTPPPSFTHHYLKHLKHLKSAFRGVGVAFFAT